MTLIRLASAEEGRAILAAEDDFTRALGGFDRSFRLRTIEPVSDAEVRQFLGEQAMDFSAEEREAWDAAIADVARAAHGTGHLLPAEVLVVKTTGREERNHAYTRQNAIVLPSTRVERLRGERAIYLIAHELFHVLSRASPPIQSATFALLGFTPIGPITPPPELDAVRMTNPDAHRLGHYIQLGERAVIPMLTCPLPLSEAIGRTSVLETVKVSLLEIDPVAGTVVRDTQGAPVLIEPSATDWATRLARNTAYTIHPEEVLADNHALLLRRRLGSTAPVADPDFLATFEALLSPR